MKSASTIKTHSEWFPGERATLSSRATKCSHTFSRQIILQCNAIVEWHEFFTLPKLLPCYFWRWCCYCHCCCFRCQVAMVNAKVDEEQNQKHKQLGEGKNLHCCHWRKQWSKFAIKHVCVLTKFHLVKNIKKLNQKTFRQWIVVFIAKFCLTNRLVFRHVALSPFISFLCAIYYYRFFVSLCYIFGDVLLCFRRQQIQR